MKRLAALGISIIFISHSSRRVMDVCDKIIVLRDGEVVDNTTPDETNIMSIATSMVGRDITTAFAGKGTRGRNLGEVILRVEHLWVDMPGETVRDVSFQVREREIFGIGGLAGQGKLGITNGIMGMFPPEAPSFSWRDRSGSTTPRVPRGGDIRRL